MTSGGKPLNTESVWKQEHNKCPLECQKSGIQKQTITLKHPRNKNKTEKQSKDALVKLIIYQF